MIREKTKKRKAKDVLFFAFLGIIIVTSLVSAVDPYGPDNLNVISNETKTSPSAQMVNISGGRIATLNLSATVQNTRWKAFVGNVTGKFTLDDSSGSTIFDWTISTLTGRVYATRNSTSVEWSSIACSSVANLEQENYDMNHTNSYDNITATFNTTASATHEAFYVGSTLISANSCPTLNAYSNSVADDNYWEEMALYDNTNVVYAAILEDDQAGFDNADYDFQMIVPENGDPSLTGATPYYIYLEIGS